MHILPIRANDADQQPTKCIITQRKDKSFTSKLLEQLEYQINNNLCHCSKLGLFTVISDSEYLKLYIHKFAQELENFECICTTSKMVRSLIKDQIRSQYQCDKCFLNTYRNPNQSIQTCSWCFFTKCMICHRSQELYRNQCLCQQENKQKTLCLPVLNILRIILYNLFVALMVIPGYFGIKLQNITKERVILKFGRYIGSLVFHLGYVLIIILTIIISLILYVPTYIIITSYDIWEQFKIK